MILNKIAEDELFTSYLLKETDAFKKYVLVSKNDERIQISCKDKMTGEIHSVYLTKLDIKNLFDTLKGLV